MAETMADNPTVSLASGRRPGWAAWVLLAPLLAWLLLLVVLPTAVIVVFSFCRRAPLGSVVYEFTLENYQHLGDAHEAKSMLIAAACGLGVGLLIWLIRQRVHLCGATWPVAAALAAMWATLNLHILNVPGDLESAQWLKIAVVSINYAAISTAVCVALGYPVAYFIGKAPLRWRNVLLMGVMVPFWTSFLVRTYAWVTIFRGLQNYFEPQLDSFSGLLQSHRYIDQPLTLYPSQLGVMIGLIYTYLPFMILPIYTSVERLDNALVEAAFDLGASPLRAFRGVVLPLTKPGIVAGVVLVFVPAVGMFAVNDVLGGRREMLIGNVIERQFTAALDKPFGSAIGMLLLALFIITYTLSQRRRQGQTA